MGTATTRKRQKREPPTASAAKPARSKRLTREATIVMRATERDRDLIDEAAKAVNKTRSVFIMDSAIKSATDVLLDRTTFKLPAEQWDAFMAVLDNPPEPSTALRRAFATPAPWEK